MACLLAEHQQVEEQPKDNSNLNFERLILATGLTCISKWALWIQSLTVWTRLQFLETRWSLFGEIWSSRTFAVMTHCLASRAVLKEHVSFIAGQHFDVDATWVCLCLFNFLSNVFDMQCLWDLSLHMVFSRWMWLKNTHIRWHVSHDGELTDGINLKRTCNPQDQRENP